MDISDQSSTLWKLERAGKTVECLARLVPYGIEVDIAHDAVVMLTRSFDTDVEALSWADKKRVAREAEGWQRVALPEESSRRVI